LAVSGDTLKWSAVSESDIIGYRVYSAGPIAAKLASIKNGSQLSYAVPNGTYYVTAVDISGNESPPSNEIIVGDNP
jgi:penicillin-binding protein